MTKVEIPLHANAKHKIPRRSDTGVRVTVAQLCQCSALSPTGRGCFLDAGHWSDHKHGCLETWVA